MKLYRNIIKFWNLGRSCEEIQSGATVRDRKWSDTVVIGGGLFPEEKEQWCSIG